MTEAINSKIFIWVLGLIQPATPKEVRDCIPKFFDIENETFREANFDSTLSYGLDKGFIRCVSKKNNLYISTAESDIYLGNKLRVLKDKNRLYLLKSMRDVSFSKESAFERNTSGASSLKQLRSSTEVSPSPEISLGYGALPKSQRNFWPRVYEQLNIGSKSEALSPLYSLNYYSSNKIPDIESQADAVVFIAENIGISTYLVRDFCRSMEKYYREFEIPKKSGNETRAISAPKTFIKTTQYWIQEYFLFRLKQHDACFSFRQKISIKDNATVHLNKKFILCLDIENFYGNITRASVKSCLERNKINIHLAEVFSEILTFNGALPQGAPTSPTISNSFLYEFDQSITQYCDEIGITYSRYADDLTFGSNEYEPLKSLQNLVRTGLSELGLSLKDSKTRIISSNSCQLVTGIAINNGQLRPSRKYRKKIRAIFYKAQNENDFESLPQLCGYLNYLKSFDNGDTKYNLEKYQKIIDQLRTLKNSFSY